MQTKFQDLETIKSLAKKDEAQAIDMYLSPEHLRRVEFLSRHNRDREFVMYIDGIGPKIEGQGGSWSGMAPITGTGHRTLASRLGIPFSFYEKMMAEHPDLLEDCVNTMLRSFRIENDESVLFMRFMNDNGTTRLRAVLPEKFTRFDNIRMLEAVEGAVDEHGLSLDYGVYAPERMKLVFSGKVGDEQAYTTGVVAVNSEVGLAKPDLACRLYKEYCSNGMFPPLKGIGRGKIHFGGGFEATIKEIEDYADKLLGEGVKCAENLEALREVEPYAWFDLSGEAETAATLRNLMRLKVQKSEAMSVIEKLTDEDGNPLVGLSAYSVLDAITTVGSDLRKEGEEKRATRLEEIAGHEAGRFIRGKAASDREPSPHEPVEDDSGGCEPVEETETTTE